MKLHAVIFLAGVFLTHRVRGKPQGGQPLVARGSNVYGAGAGFNPGPFPFVPQEQPNPAVRREQLERPLVQQPQQPGFAAPAPEIRAPAPAPADVPRQVPGARGINSAAPRQPEYQQPLEEIDLRVTDLTTGGRSPPIGRNDISTGPSASFSPPTAQVVGQGVPERRPTLDNVFDGLPPLASPNAGEIGVGAYRGSEAVVGFERNSAQAGGEADAVPLSLASGYGQPEESIVARGGDTYGAGQSVEVPRPQVSGDLDIQPPQPQTKEDNLSQAALPDAEEAPPSQPTAGQRAQPPPQQDDSGEGHHMGGIEWLPESIPGEPLVDYPVLVRIPDSGFDCANQEYDGFFADTSEEARCQAFWVCHNKQQDGFLCPNGTIFNQRYVTCDWWFNVRCEESPDYYELNKNIGVVGTQINTLPAGVVAAASKVHPVFTLLSEMLHYPRVPPIPPTNMLNKKPSGLSPAPKPAEDYKSSVKIMEKIQGRQASNVNPVGPSASKSTRSNFAWSAGMLPQFNVKSHKRAANVHHADVSSRGIGVRPQRHQRHHKRSRIHKSRSAREPPAVPQNPSIPQPPQQNGQQSSQSATPEPYIETIQKIDLPMSASGSPKLMDDVTVMEKEGNITLSQTEKKIPLDLPVPAAKPPAAGQTGPNKTDQPKPAPDVSSNQTLPGSAASYQLGQPTVPPSPSPGPPQPPPAPPLGQPAQVQDHSPPQSYPPAQLPQGQAAVPPPVPPQGQPPVQPAPPLGQPPQVQDQSPPQSYPPVQLPQVQAAVPPPVPPQGQPSVQPNQENAPNVLPQGNPALSPQGQLPASPYQGPTVTAQPPWQPPLQPTGQPSELTPVQRPVQPQDQPPPPQGQTQSSAAAPGSGQQAGTGQSGDGFIIDEDVKVVDGDSSAPVEKKLHFPPAPGTAQSGNQNQAATSSGSSGSNETVENGVSIDEDIKVEEGDPAHPVEEELRYPPGGKPVLTGGPEHSAASSPGGAVSPNSTANNAANVRDPSALHHDMPSENAPLDEIPPTKAPDTDSDKKTQVGDKIQITSETVSKVVQNPKAEAIRDPSGLQPPKSDAPPSIAKKKSSDKKRENRRSKKLAKDTPRDLRATDNVGNERSYPEVRIIGNLQPLPKTSLASEVSKTVNTVDETLRLQPTNSQTYDAGTFYLSPADKSNVDEETTLTSPNNPIGVNLKIFVDQKPTNVTKQNDASSATVGQAPPSVKKRRMIKVDVPSMADAYDYDLSELPSWMHKVAAVKRSVVSPVSSAELSLHDQAGHSRSDKARQNLVPSHVASRPVRTAIHVHDPQSIDVKRALTEPRVQKIFQNAREELMKLFGGPQETLDSEIDALLGKRQSDKDKRENDMKLRLDSSSLTSYPEQGLDPL